MSASGVSLKVRAALVNCSRKERGGELPPPKATALRGKLDLDIGPGSVA
jgi:hypothetical protein